MGPGVAHAIRTEQTRKEGERIAEVVGCANGQPHAQFMAVS